MTAQDVAAFVTGMLLAIVGTIIGLVVLSVVGSPRVWPKVRR